MANLWAQGRDPRERRTHTLSQQGLAADPAAQDDELRIEHCRHRGNPESEVEGDALQNLNGGWIPPVRRTENIWHLVGRAALASANPWRFTRP